MRSNLVLAKDSRTVHAGHLYINAVHWLYKCPLCLALMERADAVAAEEAATNEQT